MNAPVLLHGGLGPVLVALHDLADALANQGIEGDFTLILPRVGWAVPREGMKVYVGTGTVTVRLAEGG